MTRRDSNRIPRSPSSFRLCHPHNDERTDRRRLFSVSCQINVQFCQRLQYTQAASDSRKCSMGYVLDKGIKREAVSFSSSRCDGFRQVAGYSPQSGCCSEASATCCRFAYHLAQLLSILYCRASAHHYLFAIANIYRMHSSGESRKINFPTSLRRVGKRCCPLFRSLSLLYVRSFATLKGASFRPTGSLILSLSLSPSSRSLSLFFSLSLSLLPLALSLFLSLSISLFLSFFLSLSLSLSVSLSLSLSLYLSLSLTHSSSRRHPRSSTSLSIKTDSPRILDIADFAQCLSSAIPVVKQEKLRLQSRKNETSARKRLIWCKVRKTKSLAFPEFLALS
jgi:hypothetical protein